MSEVKPRSMVSLARALQNFNMVTGSVETARWKTQVDVPVVVRSFTLKHTPGQDIGNYTMIDSPDHDTPLGTASDQVYADLSALATFLRDVPGCIVDVIVGGADVDPDTGEVFTGKKITRVSFPEGEYPVFILRRIETKNSGREVFKVEAFDPEGVAEDAAAGEDKPEPGKPDFGPEPDAGRRAKGK